MMGDSYCINFLVNKGRPLDSLGANPSRRLKNWMAYICLDAKLTPSFLGEVGPIVEALGLEHSGPLFGC
jgi:hypothetical protein